MYNLIATRKCHSEPAIAWVCEEAAVSKSEYLSVDFDTTPMAWAQPD